MVAYSGNDPVNVVDIAETFASKGLLVKYGAGGILMTAAVTDTPIAYTISESSRDADSALEAAGTGTVSVVALDGVCYLKAGAAIASPKFGLPIYLTQTSGLDGCVDDDSSNSATLVGYYFGGEGAIAAGDYIPVSC